MIQVEWGNPEKTIILWEFTYPWTWEEYYGAQNDVYDMVETVLGQVDSIYITSKQQRIPKDAIIHLRNVVKRRHQRSNLIVIVGAKPRLAMLVNRLLDLVPDVRPRFHYVTTLEEAYAFLAKQSETALEQRNG